MLKYYDFHCSSCDSRFDALVDSDATEETCPNCGAMASRTVSAVRVGAYNDPAAKSAALKKRSYEHSMKEAKKNADQIAAKMGGHAKAQAKWNLRSQKPKAKKSST